jgi:hypothetical protein
VKQNLSEFGQIDKTYNIKKTIVSSNSGINKFTGIDHNGTLYLPGDTRIDGRTGTISGPSFNRSLKKTIRRISNSRVNQWQQ